MLLFDVQYSKAVNQNLLQNCKNGVSCQRPIGDYKTGVKNNTYHQPDKHQTKLMDEINSVFPAATRPWMNKGESCESGHGALQFD